MRVTVRSITGEVLLYLAGPVDVLFPALASFLQCHPEHVHKIEVER